MMTNSAICRRIADLYREGASFAVINRTIDNEDSTAFSRASLIPMVLATLVDHCDCSEDQAGDFAEDWFEERAFRNLSRR